MTKKQLESRMEKYHSTETKKDKSQKAFYDKGFKPKYDTEKVPKEKFNWKLVIWTFIGCCGALILLTTFLNMTQPNDSAQHQRAVKNEKIQKSQNKAAEKQAQQNENLNQSPSNSQGDSDGTDYYQANNQQTNQGYNNNYNNYQNQQPTQTTTNRRANYQQTQTQQTTTQGAGYYSDLNSAQQAGIQAVDSGTASNYQVVNNGKGYTLILEH